MVTRDDVLKIVRRRHYSPMTAEQLADKLDVPTEERDAFFEMIREMELSGDLVEVKQKQLALPEKLGLVIGKLDCTREGHGYVVPVKPTGKRDIYVSASDMNTAMDGDLVVVRPPTPGRRRKRGRQLSGKIVRILRRAHRYIVGIFHATRKFQYVIPQGKRFFHDIYVAPGDEGDAKPGDCVSVEIIDWPSRHLNPEGRVIKVLGPVDDCKTDAKMIIEKYELPTDFPDSAESQADEIGSTEPSVFDIRERKDYRDQLTFTIDPPDAQDFDDAVSVEVLEDGWRLYVHIADVSHFVPADSPLDISARNRGTSVYLPNHVLPMLPAALSNNACCLRQGKDRLTKTVVIEFDSEARVKTFEIQRSLIRSRHRLTYDEVEQALFQNNAPGLPIETYDMLQEMLELSRRLRQRRVERGALLMDVPKPQVHLDENEAPIDVEPEPTGESHNLIEEFMLAANECVARFLSDLSAPCMYRIHPEPDPSDLEDFAEIARILGFMITNPSDIVRLQHLLEAVKNDVRGKVVNYLLLRSLTRAQYSAYRGLHFALATEYYCHFTSPIRRYPDLLVHRMLDAHFDGKFRNPRFRSQWQKRMESYEEHLNMTERRADEAERDLLKIKIMRLLDQHRDQPHRGIVTSIHNFGFFVELEDYLIDGLVHMRTLTDDVYHLDPRNMCLRGARSKRTIRIGDLVEVAVEKVDIYKLQVDFALVLPPEITKADKKEKGKEKKNKKARKK